METGLARGGSILFRSQQHSRTSADRDVSLDIASWFQDNLPNLFKHALVQTESQLLTTSTWLIRILVAEFNRIIALDRARADWNL
jgi:hypothetical protein